jgi:carbonic anhydrase
VGHYGCSGVNAALRGLRIGIADNWIRHVRDVHDKHKKELSVLLDDESRLNRLCELNVLEQVINICQTTMVQDAWAKQQELAIHGCIYGIKDGVLRDLHTTITSQAQLMARESA